MNIKIGLAQISATPDIESNIQKGLRMTEEATSKGAQIICFPEMSFLPFFPQYVGEKKYFEWSEAIPGPTVERFQAKAKELNIVTIINLYEKAAPGEYYDCSPVIDADGKLLGISRMMHIAESQLYHEKFYYTPGNTDYPVFETKLGVRIGIAICYDGRFPEHMRILTLKGAQVVFRPTANVGSRLKAKGFESVMFDQVNARANGIFVAVANRVGLDGGMRFSGGSYVVNPKGEVLDPYANRGQDELLIVDLDLKQIDELRNTYYFLRDRRPETYETLCEVKRFEGLKS